MSLACCGVLLAALCVLGRLRAQGSPQPRPDAAGRPPTRGHFARSDGPMKPDFAALLFRPQLSLAVVLASFSIYATRSTSR